MGLKVEQSSIQHASSLNTLSSVSEEHLHVIRGVAFAPREIKILACLTVKQKINKQIAFILSIPEEAIQFHIENILKKIQCHSKNQIIEWVEQADEHQELIDLYNSVLFPEATVTTKQKKYFLPKGVVLRIDKKKASPWYMDLLRQGKSQLTVSLFLCVTSILSLYLTFKGHEKSSLSDPKELIESTQIIRSLLAIPVESTLLLRPKIVKQIENKLEERSEISAEASIPTVALVGLIGVGGVGKTTLARYYARSHNYPLIWEINAETKESLINSYKDLASSIVKTKKQKEELECIECIESSDQKEKELLKFIKMLLKSYASWLLIYDNVENYINIKTYLPDDPRVWGNGKVIITTRDANIINTCYIKSENVIELSELNDEEVLVLFCKILYGKQPDKLTKEQKDRTKEFLKKIPPFPLDVSTAAYYIKNNGLSYSDYLKRIAQFNQNVESSQQALLKEVSAYEKTRYGIITSSLAKIMESNPEFWELLLFISLLDSQNIPKNLLEFHKDSLVVDAFIHELKRYSLISADSGHLSSPIHSFSIHRNTKSVILDYLTKEVNLGKIQELVRQLSIVFGNYVNTQIEQEGGFSLKFLAPHADAFLNRGDLIPADAKVLLTGHLGGIFFYLREYTRARKLLEESLGILEQSDLRSHPQVCQFLAYLANIYMEEGLNQKAKEMMDQALLLYKDYLSKNQLDGARTLASMGYVYMYIGEYGQAEKVLDQSIRIYEKFSDNQSLARAQAFRGSLDVFLGKYEQAKMRLEKSLLFYQQHFPDRPLDLVACSCVLLGNAYMGLGSYEKAKNFLQQGLEIYQENLPDPHADTAWAMLFLADAYICLKDYKKAEEITKKSVAMHEQLFEQDNIRMAEAQLHQGNIYRYLKDFQKAKIFLEKSLATCERVFGKNHIEPARVLRDLGLVYLCEDKLKEAEDFLSRAFSAQQKHPDTYLFSESMSDLFLRKSIVEKNKNFKEQAINYLKQAMEQVQENFPKDSPHLKRLKTKLDNLLT